MRRLRRPLAQKRGPKRRRGRPSKNRQRARKRQGPTKKEQAYFVWTHRHLLVTRPEHHDGRQRRWLSQMFGYLPATRMLRDFVLQVYRLFDPEQSLHQAAGRRAVLVKDAGYLADPDLAGALGLLGVEKFGKMMAFLHSPVAQEVRTNNHVERTNRRLRHFEKVPYKWRRRRTIVRFIVLVLDRWRNQRMTNAENADTPEPNLRGTSTSQPVD